MHRQSFSIRNARSRISAHVEFTSLDDIARMSVERWQREGVVGGYTHLKEARAEIRT